MFLFFSERKIREKYREVHEAFATRYPNVVQAWSYKTNYLQAICAIFHDEGALAEVVSEFEYEKARKLGVPGSQILFNGPHKTLPALRKAVEEGAQIHVDHLDEINDLEQIASELEAAHSEHIMLVSHLPFIGRLASLLLTGDSDLLSLRFANAGVAALALKSGRWQLVALLSHEMT